MIIITSALLVVLFLAIAECYTRWKRLRSFIFEIRRECDFVYEHVAGVRLLSNRERKELAKKYNIDLAVFEQQEKSALAVIRSW